MKMKFLTSILFLAFTSIVNAGGSVMPDKWRIPTKIETYQEYSKSHLNILISGDFNGNGLNDGAIIGISSDNKSQVLLVFIYDSNLNEKWQVLDSTFFSGKISMGLGIIKPGKHKVLCMTKEECSKSYKKEIIIENDSIDYFRPESANSIYVFREGEFQRIWQSD